MSAKLSYKSKSKVLYRDRLCIVQGAVTETQLLITDANTGDKSVVHASELEAPDSEPDRGRQRLQRPEHEEDLAEAKRRLEIIKPVLDLSSGRTQAVEIAARAAGVSVSTIFNWIKHYRGSGRLSDLAPQRKGRSMPSRLSKEVEAIIQSVIDDYYLTRQKPTDIKAIEEVERRCRAARLRPPHANSIRKRLSAIDPKEKLAKREGRKAAHDRYGEIKGEFPDGKWPLAVVQIDHTLLVH